MISAPLTKFVLTAALRDKMIITFLLLTLIASSMATFLGSAAITEQDQFSLVYASGALRLIGVVCLVLFVSFHIRRAFESKEVEFLLSRPISRVSFVLSHAAAFLIISVCISALIALVVYMGGNVDLYGWQMWSLSLLIEGAIVAVMAMFFAMVLSSAAGAALACLGFYALARIMGVILGIAAIPTESFVDQILAFIIEFISVFVPRLDLMAQTSWLVYGEEVISAPVFDRFASEFAKAGVAKVGMMPFVVLQGIVFSGFLLICTSFDFVRKQF